MRTAGLTMNDVWADRVLRERGVETDRHEGLAAEIGVLVESVELTHKSKEQNYRPYLHMSGELRSVTPADGLSYGISQVIYSPGQGEKVDAFYEFDDEQLVALAAKGYFSNSFAVPEQITGIEWELPATVDVLVLAPSGMETDVPVVFTQVRDIAGLETDLGHSGYDLTDYFADYSKDGVTQVEEIVDERGLRARSDAINSLFTEDELAVAEQEAQSSIYPSQEADQPAGRLDTRLQQVEAQVAAEREQYQAERERTEGTPENLYHERVAQALRTDEEREPDTRPAAPVEEPDGGLDLDADLETDEPFAGRHRRPGRSGSSLDERKRDVARRAADLDLEDEKRDLEI